jgi:hypothetical protein
MSLIVYVDEEFFSLWNDLYDSNLKLSEAQFEFGSSPNPGFGASDYKYARRCVV